MKPSSLMFRHMLGKTPIWTPTYDGDDPRVIAEAFGNRIREDLTRASVYIAPASVVTELLAPTSPPDLLAGAKAGWLRLPFTAKHIFVEIERINAKGEVTHIGTLYHAATLDETYNDVAMFPAHIAKQEREEDPDFLDRMIATLDTLGATRVVHTATFLSDDKFISGPISTTTFAVNDRGVIVQQGLAMLTGQGVDTLPTKDAYSAVFVAWQCHVMVSALADGALEAHWATKSGDPRPYRILSRKKEVPWPPPQT